MIYSKDNLKKRFIEYLKSKTLLENLSLDIVLIGDDLASKKYTEMKQKIGKKLGITVNLQHFFEKPKFTDLQNIIKNTKSTALIFQLPVELEFQPLVLDLPFVLDVDLLGLGSSQLWQRNFLPPTVGAIDLVLKDILFSENQKLDFETFINSQLDLNGKKVAVIGQGVLVGYPLVRYLKDRGATIFSFNKFSTDIANFTNKCDILISAAGTKNLIQKTWLNPKAVLVDASTSESDGSLVGDINPENIYETNILCPSPGGIGNLTVLYLFWNTYKLKTEIRNAL
jgi:methylenetetrahydrofolate dehydrogenase (NADP+)/methenyltetrahydrofolate cyclohydrolase